jgi:hypothetical protein
LSIKYNPRPAPAAKPAAPAQLRRHERAIVIGGEQTRFEAVAERRHDRLIAGARERRLRGSTNGDFMIGTKRIARLAPALALIVAAFGLAACNGASERAGQEAKEDVRGMRDFFRDRGVTIDTRLPER